MRKLYCISGLGADKRVFKKLNIKCELIPIDWIEVEKKESLKAYSHRLAEKIDTRESFGILGVSFGGLVAVEISKILNPKITILISSVETKNELRLIYKIMGKSKLVSLVPEQLFSPPILLAYYIFGARDKKLLKEILHDTDLKFAKWAVRELLYWKNEERLKNRVVKIGGEKDKLIPPRLDENLNLIKEGGHFMIVDKAEEISEIINLAIQDLES